MKPVKTRIYARVSHDEQKKFGFSIDNQLDRLRNFSKENNLIIVDEYIDEGFSAGSTKRPELQRMLKEVQRNEIILFTKLDRFSRNVLDANEMVKLFNRKNISIKATDEPLDTSTADGMFDFNLRVSLAQRELEKGSERITTVFKYKVKQGQPISGNVAYGYKIEEINGNKKVVKDLEIAPIIDDLFEHFLTYQSIRQTTIYINNKYNLDRTYITFNRLLKNEFYAGIYRDNKHFCEPYITEKTFNKIQGIIKNNIKVRKNNYVYLFSGLVTCPTCGRKMSGIRQIGKNGTEYYYYRCGRKILNGSCKTKNIKEHEVEEYLLQNINRLIEDYIYEATVKIDKKPKPRIDVKEITEEMDRLNLQFRKGRIKEKEYDYEYELLEKQLKQVEKEIPEEADISSLEDFLNSGWKNVYNALPKEDKRALFRSIIKEITIEDGEFVIEFL